ncbi:hypothetical protein ACT7DL_11945 [Bacillus paranthracis]
MKKNVKVREIYLAYKLEQQYFKT